MFRIKICIILVFLLVGCSLHPASQHVQHIHRGTERKWTADIGDECK